MQQLFDAPWDRLDVESVERFLADADDEGLLWEAKGTKAPRRESVQKAVCGFANALGGYLVLGAERTSGSWKLSGVEFPNDEPGTWVSSLIAPSGVAPLPAFEAKAFELANGRHAVVVQVEPLATPPCITASGVAYQRVSGQTLPITDQRALADLLQKGATARLQTEGAALRAAQRLMAEPETFGPPAALFAIGICASRGPADKARVLFNEERATQFHKLVRERLQPDVGLAYGTQSMMQQDCLRVWVTSQELGAATTASAFWDGAVGVVLSAEVDDYTVSHLTHDVSRFWRALAEAVRLFGGIGEAHLAVVLNTSHAWLSRVSVQKRPRTDVRRWTQVGEPSSDELASVTREIERAFGRARWEPDAG